ncbi:MULTISPECIES: hypothetical protein [Kitasatospora]|uniref:Uncharacterized protein n=1 Tax=Kitasatospora setae (strain ATCC 33774 / DSM 43861 / JCM 3304 / KCC A-0304 / NBRC 14216 / KM-6054) TaxID=452652 RepID=E4NJB3_KITSK|nr:MULTISPECIES: hypothetical protein [Kitasatospora]BAJ33061.1 hypothetical protein KSE_73060 [Kitasatospora setae KM-6054]
MSAPQSNTEKPKNLRCAQCNGHVDAVHAGTSQDDAGNRVERWEHGPCHNPQCSKSTRTPRF